MAVTSYASAAAAATPTNSKKPASTPNPFAALPQHESSAETDIFSPPPTSLTLAAALSLLDSPLVAKTMEQHVFLVTRDYLQNWIFWAYHQPVPQEEVQRLQKALRQAASFHKLTVPSINTTDFSDPGPVFNKELSDENDPLLLRKGVQVSCNNNTEPDVDPKAIACAVPEPFYELLRSVHGVVSEDNQTISFQPYDTFSDVILYHWGPSRKDNEPVRPVEFRRRVLLIPEQHDNGSIKRSPETTPTKDGETVDGPRLIPTVEVYPLKVVYSIILKEHGSIDSDVMLPDKSAGFLLVSAASKVVETMPILTKAMAPEHPTSCVRLWSKRQTCRQQDETTEATMNGDGYDLIVLETLDGKLIRKEEQAWKEKSAMEMGAWVYRQNGPSRTDAVDILVETRVSASIPWARTSMEFPNRLQVGDFVDAQDSTGKWYEAVIREISEDTVKVHYLGWASKWDTVIRRFSTSAQVAGVPKSVNAPAPLWSHTPRWRESISIGDSLEIRESTSSATKPKWYNGCVQQVAKDTDAPRKTFGGAKLEKNETVGENGNSRKQSLLLLMRRKQILVEVPQERLAKLSVGSGDKMDRSSLRWVDLYSEEICKSGTHLKGDEAGRPALLRYDYDTRRPPVEVLKTFNNMHGSGFIRESLRGQPPAPGSVGLQNLGNSCFMNSIIQCVNHIEPLTEFFLRGTYIKEINRNNPLGSGGMVSTSYAQLLNDMWGGDYSVLAPRLLKRAVASFAPQFNNVFQHDSHEFCSVMLDAIHEDCNRVETKPYVEEMEGFGMADDKVAIESWRKHLLRHDSVIVDHCQGLHRSHLTCPVCARESIKFDVFSSISLPLAASKGGAAIPLDDCLEKFTEGEQLDENNAWYCETCQKHVCALKMLALWSVPDILVLHLKRFTYEHRGNGVVRNKVEDKVIFPIDNLDMRPYILGPIDEDAPPVYNLFGVSEHSGSTANSGHYTATVRNSSDGNWYRYNDSHVGTSSGDASVTGGAYLLFYKRAKGKSRWAGMAKVMEERGIDPHGALDRDQDGFTQVKAKKKKKKSP